MSIEAKPQEKTVTYLNEAKGKLLDEFNTFIDARMPDFINGAANGVKSMLKNKLKSFVTALGKEKESDIAEMKCELSSALSSIETDKNRALDAVVGKMDDWAAALGADPKLVAALKLIPDLKDGIMGIRKAAKQIKNNRHDITVNAGALIAEIIGLVTVVLILVLVAIGRS